MSSRRFAARAAGWLVVSALLVAPAVAQTPGRSGGSDAGQQTAAVPAPPVDTLGRDTPRGTVLGFMAALRRGNTDLGVLYLDTDRRDDAARELAQQLYVVLDKRLPARLPDLTDRPEGALANPFKPQQDVVGTMPTAEGPLDVIVERSEQDGVMVWRFSGATLARIPDVYREIDLVSVDRHLPGFLKRPRLAGIRLFEWLIVAIAIPVAYWLVTWIDRRLARLVTRRRQAAPSSGSHFVPKGLQLLLLVFVIRWVLAQLDLPLIERRFWLTTTTLLATIGVVWLLLSLNAAGERYIERRLIRFSAGEVKALLRLGRRLADVLVIAAGVLAVFAFFDVDPTAALAGLGIGGIAVALAAQKTLENVIGGLSIIFDKAVRVGDSLRLGDTVGTVEYIGLRSTRIRTLDRTIVVVPNGQIANINIENTSMRDMFWFHHFVALGYDTPSAQMRAVIDGLRGLLEGHRAVSREVIRVRMVRIGSFSLDIELFAYILAADWEQFLTIQQELLLRSMEIVEQAGVKVAVPSQELRLATAPAWADRSKVAPTPRP